MKKWIISSVFALISLQSSAQVDPVGDFNRHTIANWKGDYIRVSQYRVKGTPYFLGESFPGTISYKDGKTVSGVKVLYDLYAQKAGIDLKANELFEEEHGVKQFTIDLPEKFGGKKMLFVNADVYDSSAYKGYFNVLEEGANLALLKAYRIQLVTDPSQNLVKDVRAFDQYYTYFLYNKKTNKLQKIKLREKDLMKDINDEKVNIFAKDNEIDFSKEADVVRVLKYYNTL